MDGKMHTFVSMAHPSAHPVRIHKYHGPSSDEKIDLLAVEEPLEIKLGYGPEDQREQRSLAITMRTPGNDLELALGFLYTEGIIDGMSDVRHLDHCTDSKGQRTENAVRVELSPDRKLDWEAFQRHFYTNSSCGICGKASIESLEAICPAKITSALHVSPDIIHGLGDKMREAQNVFEHTGGLHASALFDAFGNLIYMREDIGRHNALDKLIGTALFKNLLPLRAHIVMLSGRSCFELIQKSLMAGIPMVVAVGAPSSLAVQTAEEFGLSLLGFTRNASFNIYTHPQRVAVQVP